MGMFRDFKDMVDTVRSDDLKELKRTAQAQPKTSMLDGVKMANQAVGQAQQWQGQAAANGPMAAMAAYNAAVASQTTTTSDPSNG